MAQTQKQNDEAQVTQENKTNKVTKEDYEAAIEEMKAALKAYEAAKKKVAELSVSFTPAKQASLSECIQKEHAFRKKEIEQKLKEREILKKMTETNG